MCTSAREAFLIRLNVGLTITLRIHFADNRDTDPEAPSADNDQSPPFLRVFQRLGAPLSHREGRHLPEPRSGNTTRDGWLSI